jgi:hypothetical protein
MTSPDGPDRPWGDSLREQLPSIGVDLPPLIRHG